MFKFEFELLGGVGGVGMSSCPGGDGDAFPLEPVFKFEFELLGGGTVFELWVSCDGGGGTNGVEDEVLVGLVLMISDALLLELEFLAFPELEFVGRVKLDICCIFLLNFFRSMNGSSLCSKFRM